MGLPAVSVVIPTRNRRRLLAEALEALSRQTLPAARFEVLVIDNCSDDETGQTVAEFQARVPYPLLYERNDRNRGPVYSRNRGAKLARGPIIAFTDDDCAPCPEWLERGLEPFADPAVGLVCGPTVNKPGQPVRFFSMGAAAAPAENPIYPTCNILYRRRALEEAGGFDSSLFLFDVAGVPVEGGDADLAWRVKELGWTARYVPGAVVFHEVRQVSPYTWLAVHSRVVQIPLLARRHPAFRERFLWWGPFCRPDNLLFYLAAAGLVLAPVLGAWPLLLAAPFLARLAAVFGRNWAFLALPRFLAQLAFASVRQAVVCGALLYGSLRSRTLVL